MTNKNNQIEKMIEEFFTKMGLEVKASFEMLEDIIYVNIEPEDSALSPLLIGRKGENLNSIQHLIRVLTFKNFAQEQKIVLDVNGYRRKQEETIKNMALYAADQVKKFHRVEVLQPMSAFERRLVHVAIKDVEGIATESIGDEPNRRVLIKPENS